MRRSTKMELQSMSSIEQPRSRPVYTDEAPVEGEIATDISEGAGLVVG
jgi:hypothetical protein